MKTNLVQTTKCVKDLFPKYYDLGDIVNIKKIPTSVNFVWKVDTKESSFIVKQHNVVKKRELKKFHNNIISLQQLNAPVPKIYKNKAGEYLTQLDTSYFDISEFIESDPINQAKVKPETRNRAANALAELHKTISDTDTLTIDKYDYLNEINEVKVNIIKFKKTLKKLKHKANSEEVKKLDLLNDLIEKSNWLRNEIEYDFINLAYVPTHGDPSAVNMLFDHNHTYFVDWDLFKLRPRIWDLQAAATLFSMQIYATAFITEPEIDSILEFIRNYDSKNKLDKIEFEYLWQVVAYNASYYWLGYTPPAVLSGDFRLLDLLSTGHRDKMFYWFDKRNLENYRKLSKNPAHQ